MLMLLRQEWQPSNIHTHTLILPYSNACLARNYACVFDLDTIPPSHAVPTEPRAHHSSASVENFQATNAPVSKSSTQGSEPVNAAQA